MTLEEKRFKAEKKDALRAAKELGYGDECLIAIKCAKNVIQIDNALITARKKVV